MFDNNGQPLRIVVETVPHEVVARLDQKDVQLQNQINSLRNMLNETFDVIGQLRKELRSMQSR